MCKYLEIKNLYIYFCLLLITLNRTPLDRQMYPRLGTPVVGSSSLHILQCVVLSIRSQNGKVFLFGSGYRSTGNDTVRVKR